MHVQTACLRNVIQDRLIRVGKMDQKQFFRLFLIIERSFWAVVALLTIAGAFGMMLKGIVAIYQEFDTLKSVLSNELFYAIICFELMQMARIRLMGDSHRMVLYHFVFMAALTFGREIFLIHNLDIWIATGFVMMIVIYIPFYGWSHDRPLWISSTGAAAESHD